MKKGIQRSKGLVFAAFLGLLFSAKANMTGNAAVAALPLPHTESMAQWEQRADGWYYYGTDGNLASGWILFEGKYYYLTDTGRCLMHTITPDGYYVDENGAWEAKEKNILGISFQAPQKVPDAAETWVVTDEMKQLNREIRKVFAKRNIQVTDSAMEYISGEDETVLIGIYRNNSSDSYRLDLGIELEKACEDLDAAETYDYAVFQAFLYQLTSTPDALEAAIYSSWKEENLWNINRNRAVWIGDSQVTYAAGKGYGHYYINPVEAR